MIVAIDGPAGSGKSSVARRIAKERQLTLLDTGAMYRAITWECLQEGIDPTDESAVGRLADQAHIDFGTAADGSQTVALNGTDVTQQIRTPQVDQNVSAVSAIHEVRKAMVELQRQMGAQGDERITPDALAELTGTIPYEIMLGFGPRVARAYIN